jgi:hypothetical protein
MEAISGLSFPGAAIIAILKLPKKLVLLNQSQKRPKDEKMGPVAASLQLQFVECFNG